MKLEKLRKLAKTEVIDYLFLLSSLHDYASPRDKISRWLRAKELIRIKKGLYVFGPEIAQQPYSKELLANLVYGPSAISLTYALAYYSLIPERVSQVTSITSHRYKMFQTPVGSFVYFYLNPRKYAIGIEWQKLNSDFAFLIASPEKALCDQIHLVDKKLVIDSVEAMQGYLFHDLRIDEALFKKFRLHKLKEIVEVYQDKRLVFLLEMLKK